MKSQTGQVMDIQTFSAGTMAEALARVKATIGADAVIVHARTIQKRQWLGLRQRAVVEITAGRKPRRPERERAVSGSSSRAAGPALAPVSGKSSVGTSSPGRRESAGVTYDRPAARQPLPGKLLLEQPAGQTAMMLGIAQEMTDLKTLVKDLVSHEKKRRLPQVPEDLFEHYMRLIENHVAEELAGDMVRTLQRDLKPTELAQADIVTARLAEQIEKMIPVSGPIKRTKLVGPHVVALIGPTGVGKTTTVAKLAANLQLRQKHKVGLITIDTYRIAAIDQLRKYADILQSKLKVVGHPEDMGEAVRSMHDCEYILIDTAGRSPNDMMKLNELRQFLTAASPDEVHLVLSTTANQACVDLAVQRFGEVGVDRIIFTKLDEAARVGVVLNVIRKVNKSLSYVTMGQAVPDDIEVGMGRDLARLILGGAQ
jgi:flagellar biosynthesis protein FlhF